MLGNIISAGANIVGGILGSNDKKKDRQLQKDFAQQGIRWKVADAKAAGIHPLAALGAQTMSYSPVSIGGPSVASGLAAAGQDISRAVNATRGGGERLDAYTKTIQDLNLRRMGLENDLLASQIAKINTAGTPPAMPGTGDRYLVEGQGNSPLVSTNSQQRVASAPEAGSQEPGAITDTGYARTPTGWAPVMSKDVKDRLEEDLIGMLAWNVRNRLAPTLDAHGGNPPAGFQKDGDMWVYSPIHQEYRRVPQRRGRYGFSRWYQ